MSPAFRPGPVPRSEVPPEDELRSFSVRVRKIGINPVVEIPEDVGSALGVEGVTPVCGLLEDTPIRGTFVPAGDGRYRLFLNTAMREAAEIGVGDTVRLALARDERPRETVIPDDLRRMLEEEGSLLREFESLTPSRRREFVVWLEDAKRPETREGRLARILAHLVERR